ncbi:hypothetical protein D477_015893 [Arthrobacter crystallopoietes BAB-32]|uniref:N-acetyltransferase domain-containing protein n=1 Tax=Arthrobacter crystallopoietes BAB-32 TaxID=1246476 RepID=N1V4R3_9MICC|nr:GNAT family N-acetyltransferase [Arthrobacter crystallopoietes]EMY33228.1 hypothetical protein D477_015893 [Arthrobacter crystallopoietes BAB-32]
MVESFSLTRNDADSRYEIHVDGRLAGTSAFHASGREVAFLHTEIRAEFEGQGLAGKLAEYALSDVAGQDKTAVPHCPFIAGYLRRHPEMGARVRWP